MVAMVATSQKSHTVSVEWSGRRRMVNYSTWQGLRITRHLALTRGVEPELCKLVSLPIDVAARRTPSGRGRCPMAMARSQIPEDYTRTQRWRTGAKTSLPGRKWLVRQCGQTSLKCTTCAPGESGSTLRGPRVYGEYPARTSWPCEARPATASEGL